MSISDILGQGDGSVGKLHTEQAYRSEFRFPCRCTKLGMVAHDYNQISKKAETRDNLWIDGLLSQPNW